MNAAERVYDAATRALSVKVAEPVPSSATVWVSPAPERATEPAAIGETSTVTVTSDPATEEVGAVIVAVVAVAAAKDTGRRASWVRTLIPVWFATV